MTRYKSNNRERGTYRNRREKQANSVMNMLRLNCGKNVTEVAQEAGVHPTVITKGEAGLFHGRAASYEKVARYFGVSLEDLILGNLSEVLTRIAPPLPADVDGNRRKEHSKAVHRLRTGSLGEQIVEQLEIQRLAGTGYEQSVCREFADDPRAGFDILSYDSAGNQIYIEVKSTSGDEYEPFPISKGELRFIELAKEKGLDYRIYRLYGVRSLEEYQMQVFTLADLDKICFEPQRYTVTYTDQEVQSDAE